MSEQDQILGEFFDQQTQEQQQAQQESFNNASSEEQQRINLEVSGRYRMEVATFAWADKTTGKMMTSPHLQISKNKSLMVVLSLKVVDGTDLVPAGASRMTNLVLLPASGANKDTIDKTMNMVKPRLVALLGTENISLTAAWINENLIPKFEQVGERFNMIKDHNMKQHVMVTWEDDFYQNQATLNMKSIVPAKPGEKSVSNRPASLPETQGFAADEAAQSQPAQQQTAPAQTAPAQTAPAQQSAPVNNEQFSDIDASAAAGGAPASQIEDF